MSRVASESIHDSLTRRAFVGGGVEAVAEEGWGVLSLEYALVCVPNN
jgi:hypothetical protein